MASVARRLVSRQFTMVSLVLVVLLAIAHGAKPVPAAPPCPSSYTNALPEPATTQCIVDSDFSYRNPVRVNPSFVKRVCASTACRTVNGALAALNLAECVIGSGILARSQIIDYFGAQCGSITPTNPVPGPGPAPGPTPAPAPGAPPTTASPQSRAPADSPLTTTTPGATRKPGGSSPSPADDGSATTESSTSTTTTTTTGIQPTDTQQSSSSRSSSSLRTSSSSRATGDSTTTDDSSASSRQTSLDRNQPSGSRTVETIQQTLQGGSESGMSGLMIGVITGVSVLVVIGLGAVIYAWYNARKKATQGKTLDTTTTHLDASKTLSTRPVFEPLSSPVALLEQPQLVHKALSKSLTMGDADNSSRERSSSLLYDDDLLALQVRTGDIEDIKVVGSGGYGIVYLVMYRRTRLLASKRIVPDQVTRRKTMAFIEEIKLVSTLQHPCIVEFVGAAWTTESDLQALFEYMPQGDLLMYLTKQQQQQQNQRPVTPSWTREKLQIALDIIDALVYVHSFDPPLVHRDLKSRNVLLSAELRAKLSDFGISRHQSENCSMTTGMGTNRWMAPEVIMGGGDYDQSCDIYSFGVLLTEMDTHMAPFTDIRSVDGMEHGVKQQQQQPSDLLILQMIALGRLQPEFSGSCPCAIKELGVACMAYKRDRRPSAVQVATELRQMIEQMQRR